MNPSPPPSPAAEAPADARPSLAWPQLHEGERMPRRLRWVLGAIVTMVLGLASVEYIVVERGESLRETDGEAMRLIVRQGALAERLGREGARLASGQGDPQALAQTLRTMVDEGGQLHDLRRQWDGPDTTNLAWTDQRERLWATAQSLLMAVERGDRDMTAFAERLHAQADAFRAPVDATVTVLGSAIEQRRAQVQSQHARLIGLLAVMVSITVALIGEPLARHLARQHRRLADQGRELQRLALVADRTGRAVLIADADGRVTWTNDAYRQTTGRAPEDTLGQPLADLLGGDGTDPATARRLADALRARGAARLDLVLRGAAGQPVWIDMDLQPLHDDAGGHIAVLTDVTAQIMRRRELDTLLGALPAGVVVTDLRGRVTEANPMAEDLLAAPPGSLPGRGVDSLGWEIVGPDGRVDVDALHPVQHTLLSGEPVHGEPVGVRLPDGGRRWLRMNTHALPGEDGAAGRVVSCFVDDTLLRTQAELLRLTVDGAGLGTWHWDIEQQRVSTNERGAAMLGLSMDALPTRDVDWLALIHPDDRRSTLRALLRVLREPQRPYRHEYRIAHRGVAETWLLAAGACVERDADGRARGMAGVHVDITPRKRLEQALTDAAMTDPLTRLPNRASIRQRLERCIARVRQDGGPPFALLFMDFDRFKLVNDSLGHEAGDELLRQVAARLRSTLRAGDTVQTSGSERTAARLGGDEFVLLLASLRAPDDALQVAQRLLGVLSAPYRIGNQLVETTVSIGVVTSDVTATSVGDVLRDADTAMYEAKRLGRNRVVAFRAELHERVKRAMDLGGDLRLALRRGEISAAYQPIVDLVTLQTVGAEALARWTHPQRGPISPAEFVPLAEEQGVIADLGLHILRTACADLATWRRALGSGAPETVSVNLSRAQLERGRLVERVREALAEHDLPPSALRLEITESLAMTDEAGIAVLHELRQLGVRLALDDFGTGYSSLASLDQLPIDMVKIDRGFVAGMHTSAYRGALVRATVQVGAALKLRVVAEGVETADQAMALIDAGCHLAQGWYFGKPVPAAAFADALRPSAPLPEAA